ncbi:winged helix-turn-helix domain-containing protein [Halomarina rubra]|uniref:Helix-turn-helix domain-containing protein n=1 Tax=Halomarina rubra TaxID=2071873 RepID=A0ABD6ASV3_9EURY|nr:helix-turn-helix domain-containing protein [Halomarina rubra]
MGADDGPARSRIEVSTGSGDLPRSLDPDAAFKAIGNETRLAILDTLWGAHEAEPMGFAALRKAVGIRDGSKFNYHLQRLLEAGFIEKVDGEYGVRHAGAEVVWAVRSGSFTEHPELDPFETTGHCLGCERPLSARYADEMFFVECTDCDRLYGLGWFPPGALRDRTPEEAVLVWERVMRADVATIGAGICPKCNGVMDQTLAREWSDVPVASPYLDTDSSAFGLWFVCRRCSVWAHQTPGEFVVDHPLVVDLYYRHGVDLRSTPRWELPWVVDESFTTVVSEDPFRVRLAVAVADEELRLTLDESFDVLAVE